MKQNDLEGASGVTETETALRARKLLAEVEDRELRLALKKREYVALKEVRTEWTRRVAQARNLLIQKFAMELPPILSGLVAIGIQKECQRALLEVYTTLHQGGAEG